MLHKMGIAGNCERCGEEILECNIEGFEMTGEFICPECFDEVCAEESEQ